MPLGFPFDCGDTWQRSCSFAKDCLGLKTKEASGETCPGSPHWEIAGIQNIISSLQQFYSGPTLAYQVTFIAQVPGFTSAT